MITNKEKNNSKKNRVEEPIAAYGTINSVFHKFAIKDDYKLLKKAREGLRTDVFYSLADAIKMPEKTLASVINLSPRTISNYRDQEKELDPIYSEHLLKFWKRNFGEFRRIWTLDEPSFLEFRR